MSSPSSLVLQRLHHLDRSLPNFHDQLCNVLYGEEYIQCAPNLQGNDLVWIVDYLDGALDGLDPSSPAFRKCLRELRNRCGAGGILPASYTLSPHRLNVGSEPFASGTYGDVYEGTLDGSRICIKRIRVYIQDGPQKAARIFCQEAIMWKHLRHSNILSLLGVTITPKFQLISNWMSGGDLPGYIKKNPNADRLKLISDVANGLCYLHSRNVVHGDLKGQNILMDYSGDARIADFGFATVTQNLDSVQSAKCQRGTLQWTAPEVLNEEPYSKEADVFSFAMVMIEVFTGTIPFSGKIPAVVISAITQGNRPPRPTHPTFTENLWTLMQRCWDNDRHLRPEVSEALQVLISERLTCVHPQDNPSQDHRANVILTPSQKGRKRKELEHEAEVKKVREREEALERERRQKELEREREEKEARERKEKLEKENRRKELEREREEKKARERKEVLERDERQKKVEREKEEKKARELEEKFEKERSQRELERKKEEEGAREFKEKLEKEKRRKELEREKEERARERREELERKRQEEFEREKKEKEAEEVAKKAKKILKEAPKPTKSATAALVQTKGIPARRPTIPGSSSDGGNDDKNAPPVTGSSGRVSVDKSALSPTENRQGSQGSQSRNPSRVYLPNNSSQDHLTQYSQSRTNLHEGDGGGSWLGLHNIGDGTLSRRTSKRETPGVNAGHTAGNTSRHDLRIGSKSRNQSCVDVGETLLEDHEPLPPQKHRDQREPLQEPRKRAGASNLEMNSGPRGNRERETNNVPRSTLNQSSPPAWKRLISYALTMEERVSLIAQIFSDRDQVEMVNNLSGDDAQTFVDMVDEVLDRLAPEIRKKCSRSIHRICGRQALLPRSLAIPLCYNPAGVPLCHGGFADVWKGQHQGQEVAAKVLKVYERDLERVRRGFCKEVAGWKTLRHPNILPLLGVTMSENRLVIVSKWMVNGNINEFVEADPNADRLGLLLDATAGLIYMHDEGMVHGDLKGANILINDNGRACLADFSLLTVAPDQSTVVSSYIQGGTIQWMSPELLDPERFGLVESRPTKESDCYALGMVVYEVLSGQRPFAPSPLPSVILKVLEDQRPERPQGKGGALLTDDLWEVLGLCWKRKPDERTNAKVVLQCLERTSLLLRLSPDMDRIVEMDTDESLDVTVHDSGITIKPGGSGLPVPPRHTAITVPSPHIPPQNDPLTKVNSPVKIDPPVETGPPAKVDPPTELEPPAKAEPPVEEQSGCRCVIM